MEGPSKVTEGGVRGLWKKLRAGERSVYGFGKGGSQSRVGVR